MKGTWISRERNRTSRRSLLKRLFLAVFFVVFSVFYWTIAILFAIGIPDIIDISTSNTTNITEALISNSTSRPSYTTLNVINITASDDASDVS